MPVDIKSPIHNSVHNKPAKSQQQGCLALLSSGQTHNISSHHRPLQSLKHSIEILRLEALEKVLALNKVFQLSKDKICEYFAHYHTFPLKGHPHFTEKELIQSQNLKLIKSETKLYFGQIHDKKRQGKGVAVIRDGKIYEGLFQKNERCGFGVEIYPNRNLYIGDFLNGKKHGKGRFYWFNLSKSLDHKNSTVQYYQGYWWGDQPDGYGIHCRVNGDYYQGTFKNGLKHGKGNQKLANGDTYTGQYANGLPQGVGQYHLSDGSSYHGDLKQGLRCGYGCWTLQTESYPKLSKSLKNNRYHSLQIKNEFGMTKRVEKYKGHYDMDKKSGYGVYEWDNGWTYYGNFQKDFRNGYGQLYNQNVLVYKGNWFNGQKEDDTIGRQALALGDCPLQKLVNTTRALGVRGGIGVGRNSHRFSVSNTKQPKQQIFKQRAHPKSVQTKQAIPKTSINLGKKTYRSVNMTSIQDPAQTLFDVRKYCRYTFQERKCSYRCFSSIFEAPECQFKQQIQIQKSQHFPLKSTHQIKLKEGMIRRPMTSSCNSRRISQRNIKLLAHKNIVGSIVNRSVRDNSRFKDVCVPQNFAIGSSFNF